MSIAVFVQARGDSIPELTRQVLLVPVNNDVYTYHRLSDGNKGPGNKWSRLESFDELVGLINPDEHLVTSPVGVYVTDNDLQKIEEIGYSPVLTTKALKASLNAGEPDESNETAFSTLCEMYELVSIDSLSLRSLVIDGRRTTIEETPLTVHTVTVETIPVEDDEHLVEQPTTKQEDKMVHASLATIPNKKFAETYVNRKIHGKLDFEVFDYARKNKKNILISGPTGPGKTTAIFAYGASRGIRVASISCNASLDVSQIIGKLIPTEDGTIVWVDGPATDVVRTGGILYIDEGNVAPAKIITSLFSLTDKRRTLQLMDHMGEVIEAHPDLMIVMTMNPGYVGTSKLNAAFRNRFAIQLEWDYDPEVEDTLVSAKNLLAVARQLRAEAAKGMYETPIATNMLLEFIDLVTGEDSLGYEFAVENFIAHFEAEEQASVRLVLQTHEANIRSDFGLEMPEVDFNINKSFSI